LKKTKVHTEYLDRISIDDVGFIDEKTDSDLELKRVFELVDSTRTLPGESVLYAWLRCQCLTEEALRERTRWIESWQDYDGIDGSRKVLKKCGPQHRGSIVDEIWDPVPVFPRKYRYLLYIWLMLSIFAFASPFFFGASLLLFCVIPVAAANTLIHFRWHNRIAQYYYSISYLTRLLSCSRKLQRKLPEELKKEEDELVELCDKTRELGKYTFLFINPNRVSMDIFDSILEYFRIFLLAELVAYTTLYHRIHKLQPELKRIFEIIGSADASLCVHDFIDSDPRTCIPVFYKGVNEIEFKQLFHPLITDCVSNSAAFERGVILTGANMAGKSTFLRTLGISHVMATTLGIACAESFRIPFLRIATSLQTVDSLEQSQSHYYAEAQRLYTLWSSVKSSESRWLLLVDEILSGTNSRDSNRAATAILTDMAKSDSFVIVTTHEQDTAKNLSELFDNYHFTEEIRKNLVKFDYELKKGIVKRSNALRLLRHVGFPEELINRDGGYLF
jgi:DNA mismatch repair ATPase MutS